MKSKHFASFAIIILLMPVLFGCGSSPSQDAAPKTDSGTSGEDTSKVAAEEPDDDVGIGQQLEALLAGVEPPRSYEMNSVPPTGEPSMSMIVKMGDRQPLKVKTLHEDGWMLVDLEKGETYAFEPSENMIMKLPVAAGAQGDSMNPSDFVHPDATTLGKERVDGVTCWVVESKVGTMESKVWVGTKDGLPRQFETAEGITKFVYSRINKISDSEFDLPEGVQVMDMAAMMKQGFQQPR